VSLSHTHMNAHTNTQTHRHTHTLISLVLSYVSVLTSEMG